MEPKKSSKYTLSPEEKQFFADNGYLIIRKIFDTTACDNMRLRFRQLVNREVPRGKVSIIDDTSLKGKCSNPEDHVNKINMVSFDPEFMKYTEDQQLVNILSQLLSEGITIMNSMLINKPPGTPWHPPHQDMYHLPLRPISGVITTWTAIDETDEENGCLFVIPGSHRANEIYEENILPGFINSLYYSIKDVDKVAPRDKWVSLPMSPGDTVFLHSMLVHGSHPNTSERYRKAITSVYASNECEYIDVTGTVQEPFMTASMNELKKRGYPSASYIDLWKIRTKKIEKAID